MEALLPLNEVVIDLNIKYQNTDVNAPDSVGTLWSYEEKALAVTTYKLRIGTVQKFYFDSPTSILLYSQGKKEKKKKKEEEEEEEEEVLFYFIYLIVLTDSSFPNLIAKSGSSEIFWRRGEGWTYFHWFILFKN